MTPRQDDRTECVVEPISGDLVVVETRRLSQEESEAAKRAKERKMEQGEGEIKDKKIGGLSRALSNLNWKLFLCNLYYLFKAIFAL